MPQYDWTNFTLRVPVTAEIETIYKAWTTQEGLESWFLRKAEFTGMDGIKRTRESLLQVNDRYEWLWHGYNDDSVERGTILEINDFDFLKFSFGKAGNVSVSIKKENDETLVELVQKDIPVDEHGKVNFHLGCTKGWQFYLTNLKSILEGGIDLRNKNPELKDIITA